MPSKELVKAASNEPKAASGSLETAGKARARQNMFAQDNPTLAGLLEKYGGYEAGEVQSQIGEVLDACLTGIVTKTPAEEVMSPDFLRFLSAMETHKAKVAKLKADTEAVTQNVATPTALRRLFNDFGLDIQHGNEKAVMEMLEQYDDPAIQRVIKQTGELVHRYQRTKIQERGLTDDSIQRIINAPQ